MQGKVGSIVVDDKIVGGFLLWSVEMLIKGKTRSWSGSLSAYWLNSKERGKVTLRFHSDIEDAWWESEAIWHTMPKFEGVLVHGDVQINGSGNLRAMK